VAPFVGHGGMYARQAHWQAERPLCVKKCAAANCCNVTVVSRKWCRTYVPVEITSLQTAIGDNRRHRVVVHQPWFPQGTARPQPAGAARGPWCSESARAAVAGMCMERSRTCLVRKCVCPATAYGRGGRYCPGEWKGARAHHPRPQSFTLVTPQKLADTQAAGPGGARQAPA